MKKTFKPKYSTGVLAYYIIYKPYGMLSQFTRETPEQVTLHDLKFSFPKDAYPIGRLDKDSEGLLILTNDKRLNAAVLQPGTQHKRTYLAQVENIPDPDALRELRKGVMINIDKGMYHTLPAEIEVLKEEPVLPERNPPVRFRAEIPTTWLKIKLHEGKNRQVRKMTAHINCPTLRLVRVAIENLTIDDIQPGEVRKISPEKLFKLLKLEM
jgi:23S rRNA pseudouridine2457 synthase